MKNLTIISIILFQIILTACGTSGTNEIKFDKRAWNASDGIFYPNRKNMVGDLINNRLHKGMTYNELVELIGRPDNYTNMEPNKIAYEIEVDYGWDIDPVKGSNLIIELSKDSTIANFSLTEWGE